MTSGELMVISRKNNYLLKQQFQSLFSCTVSLLGESVFLTLPLICLYFQANNLGVGVVGVIECDFLQPTHNKQDFDYTKAYRYY